jgi:hypothetical protein
MVLCIDPDGDTLRFYYGAADTFIGLATGSIRQMDDPEFQGVDWLSVRPRIKTAPRILRPGPVD